MWFGFLFAPLLEPPVVQMDLQGRLGVPKWNPKQLKIKVYRVYLVFDVFCVPVRFLPYDNPKFTTSKPTTEAKIQNTNRMILAPASWPGVVLP
jgi:hypothetical protein